MPVCPRGRVGCQGDAAMAAGPADGRRADDGFDAHGAGDGRLPRLCHGRRARRHRRVHDPRRDHRRAWHAQRHRRRRLAAPEAGSRHRRHRDVLGRRALAHPRQGARPRRHVRRVRALAALRPDRRRPHLPARHPALHQQRHRLRPVQRGRRRQRRGHARAADRARQPRQRQARRRMGGRAGPHHASPPAVRRRLRGAGRHGAPAGHRRRSRRRPQARRRPRRAVSALLVHALSRPVDGLHRRYHPDGVPRLLHDRQPRKLAS